MIFAASYDALAMRITNGLCLLLAVAFIPAAWLAGLSLDAAALHVSCGLGALALGFVLFVAGWIGGGDAKLFAAAALWFGWDHFADFAVATALAGGVLAAGFILLRWLGAMVQIRTLNFVLAKAEMPYGIALACGALAVYPQSIWAAPLPL